MSRTSKFFTFSLIINLLLVGVIVGHHFKHVWQVESHSLQDFVGTLPSDTQKTLEPIMVKFSADMDNLNRQAMEQRKEAGRLLQAQPFDRNAYLTQMQHIYDLKKQISTLWAETLADIAEKLSPENREDLADFVAHHHPNPNAR